MIYCFGHCFPFTDIDSLVSSVLLAEYYRQDGQEARAVYCNPASLRQSTLEIYEQTGLPLPALVGGAEMVAPGIQLAMVDHNDPMESFGQYEIEKEVLLCVDHHSLSGSLRAREIRYKKIGATCSLLVEMFQERGFTMDDTLAKAAVLGIISDTMGLRNAKTSQRDKELVAFLYEKYQIGTPLESLSTETVSRVLIKNMEIDRILSNSLREYMGGRVGIAQFFVLNDDYKKKLPQIREAGWHTKHDLYIFALHIQEEQKSVIYYFDKKFNIFPLVEEYGRVISRSRDLLPHVMNQIRLRCI